MEQRFEVRKREIEKDAKINETTLAGAVRRLQQFGKPFFEHFRRSETRDNAQLILEGMLSDIPRKNVESIAYRYGRDRQALQRFVGQLDWDHRPMLDRLVKQVVTEIGEPDAILAFDPSGFEKDGKKSAGVARQWLGRFGKVDNGQVGTFLAYVTKKEYVLVNAKLFIPQAWNDDPARCQRAHIPKSEYEHHKTRHQQCLEMLDEHGEKLPHKWLTGDDEIGRSSLFRYAVRKRNEKYIFAVPSNTTIRNLEQITENTGLQNTGLQNDINANETFQRVDHWKDSVTPDRWRQIDVRDGEKQPLTLKLVTCRVLAHTECERGDEERLIATVRPDGDGLKHDYYLSNDFDASDEELARVILGSHRVEDCFRRVKGECGLADYEVQTWYGWYHHVTFSLLASWFLTKETMRGQKKQSVVDGAIDADNRRGAVAASRYTIPPMLDTFPRPKAILAQGTSIFLSLLFM